MPAASYETALTSGHGCHPPQNVDTGSPDTYINGIPAARVDDPVTAHTCGNDTHSSTVSTGQTNVFINGKHAGIIGSGVQCGGIVAEGSRDTFIGP